MVGYKNDPRSILVLLVVQPDDDVDVPRLAVAERRLPHGLTAGGQSYLPGRSLSVSNYYKKA